MEYSDLLTLQPGQRGTTICRIFFLRQPFCVPPAHPVRRGPPVVICFISHVSISSNPMDLECWWHFEWQLDTTIGYCSSCYCINYVVVGNVADGRKKKKPMFRGSFDTFELTVGYIELNHVCLFLSLVIIIHSRSRNRRLICCSVSYSQLVTHLHGGGHTMAESESNSEK